MWVIIADITYSMVCLSCMFVMTVSPAESTEII